jgi:hypothetical protein
MPFLSTPERTMQKLPLSLEDLQVDSFTTSALGRGMGAADAPFTDRCTYTCP